MPTSVGPGQGTRGEQGWTGPDSGAASPPSLSDSGSGPGAGTGATAIGAPDSGVGGASTAGSGAGAAGSPGALAAGFSGLPGVDPFGRLSRLAPLATLASTTTTLALAFLLFGKRRRDEEATGSDDDLAIAAASPYAMLGAELAPAFAGIDPGTGGTDVNLPRWRRPSLLAARKSDPVRNGAEHVNLTFGNQGESMAGGARHVVRYRLVRLLDQPDELLGQAVDSLDQGDEVEVLEHHGTYRRVVTPDGRQGWLHRMTLGDIVTEDASTASASDRPDDDVLLAYLSARARA